MKNIAFFLATGTAVLSPIPLMAQAPAAPAAQAAATAPAAPAPPVPAVELKPGSAIPVRYKLAKGGKVSINIYNESGAIVRELLNTGERNAGDNMEVWDGLDSKGQPLPAGKYSWKLLATPGLQAEYLLSTGSNYSIRPNASWNSLAPGSIASPAYVNADAGGVYVGGASENIEPALIKQSLDGTTRYWERGLGPYNAPSNQVQIGDVLWMHVGGLSQILAVDPATGGTAQTGKGTKEAKDVKSIDTTWKEGNIQSGGDSIAACDSLLAIAYTKHNAIRWYDLATRTVTATTTGIKGPKILASTGPASKLIYASDGKSVFLVNKEGQEAKEIISGLASILCMTIDPASGDVLLFDGGQYGGGDSQVKRYSVEGKLLRTYGQKGGRRDGLYTRKQQESFRSTTSISMMPDGGFVVAEPWSPPRRTAVFDRDGNWQREWYGGQMWAPWILPEPDNPNAVWMGSDWNGCMRMLVDYKTKTWKVHSTYMYGSTAMQVGNIGIGTGIRNAAVHNGELYLYKNGLILRVDRNAGTWKAAAMLTGDMRHEINIHFGILPLAIQQAVTLHRTKKYNANGYALTALRWADSDGDGKMQSSEASWLLCVGGYHDNVRGPVIGWWTDKNGDTDVQENEIVKDTALLVPNDAFMDGNLTLYGRDDQFAFNATNRRFRYLAVTGWSPSGAPLYDGTAKPLPMVGLPESIAKGLNQGFLTRDDKTGDFYMASNDSPGWGFSKASSMIKFSPDGSFQWSSGSVGSNPGQIRHFRGIFGMVKDCVAAPNTSYEWPGEGLRTTYVWDKDGLYVGGLLDNPVVNENTPIWRYALGAESIFGKVWEDAKTGEVLFFGHWLNEGRIYRITGWDNWERAGGQLELKAEAGTGGNGVLASFLKSDGTLVGQWTMADMQFDAGKELKSATAKQIAKSGKYLVRLNSSILPPADGNYTFSTNGAGNVRVLIDGRVIIDNNMPAGARNILGNPVEMKAGKRRDLQVEYSPAEHENGRISLLWNAEGQESAPVPPLALFAGPREKWSAVPYGKGIGWTARYFSNWERSGEPLRKQLENGDVNFKRDKINPAGAVTATWTGFLEARRTGFHRVRVEGAGSSLETSGRSEKYVFLQAGQRMPFSVIFAGANIHQSHWDLTGGRLEWIEPGNRDLRPVPQSQLFPEEISSSPTPG